MGSDELTSADVTKEDLDVVGLLRRHADAVSVVPLIAVIAATAENKAQVTHGEKTAFCFN